MPKFGKWMLTLGLMAATPGTVLAANPFSKFLPSGSGDSGSTASQQSPRSGSGGKRTNQQVAVEIAKALRAARLNRHEMDVSYIKGVCTLTGKVATPAEKAKATRIASRVPGVQRVENHLQIIGKRTPKRAPFARMNFLKTSDGRGVRRAGYTTDKTSRKSQIQLAGHQQSDTPQGAPQGDSGDGSGTNNQQVAEAIARSLKSAGLIGYDMEIRYENGTAELIGAVSSPQQRSQAEQITRQVSGVQTVDNRLRVSGTQRTFAPSIQRAAAYQPVPGVNGGPPNGAPPNGGPPMQGYAHGGPGAAQPVYSNANLPEHAWPSYAHYPNYAKVSYPKQYSASAWPYIGPFYPYPQVPMGWRSAQLEWDDGFWALNFNPRTDKWWWFLNPKNW